MYLKTHFTLKNKTTTKNKSTQKNNQAIIKSFNHINKETNNGN
jgi:hypothetical protein